MAADRPVHTDALATLGTLISAKEKRDAIHLAVLPAQAGQRLEPGNRIFMRDGKAYRAYESEGSIDTGIVDPFLRMTHVNEGQWFWFILKPRSIASLRHVWTHPAFPDPAEEPKYLQSTQYLDQIAERLKVDMFSLLNAAQDFLQDGEYFRHPENPGAFEGDRGAIDSTFWHHYEVLTGKKVAVDKRQSFLTCSCG